MTLTRIQALFIALGLTFVGIAAAKGGPGLRNGLVTQPTTMEPRALARGEILLIEPEEPARPLRRS